MDSKELTQQLQSAEGRTSLIHQLQPADVPQLLAVAASFKNVPAEIIRHVMLTGWLRSYFTEWQRCLKRFAYRFIAAQREASCIRLLRNNSYYGLFNELETFQLFEGGYFVDPTDATLNIQCAASSSATTIDNKKPCYSQPISEISGLLIDNLSDFPVTSGNENNAQILIYNAENYSKNIRLYDEDETASAAAVVFTQQYAQLLRHAYAHACFMTDVTYDEFPSYATKWDSSSYYYNELMKSVPDEVNIELWRIDVNINVEGIVRTFNFFTLPSDDYERIIYIDNAGLIHINGLDGESGVFHQSCVENCTFVEVKSNNVIEIVKIEDVCVVGENNNNNWAIMS